MRNRLRLLVTMIARMSVAIGTLLLLASVWKPADFGFFATAVSASTLVGLLTNYGFVMQSLREIGANPADSARITAIAFLAKAVLTFIALVLVFCFAFFRSEWSPEQTWIFSLIFAGTLLSSFGDLALNGFRALDAYDLEAKIVVVTSAFHMAMLVIGVATGLSILSISVLYMLSRAVYTFAAVRSAAKLMQSKGRWNFTRQDVVSQFRRSTPFALDAGLVNFATQLDGLLVAHFLGLNAAGIFQAGYRIPQGLVPFGAVLASLHVPVFSAMYEKGDARAPAYGRRLIFEFAVLGLVFGLAIAVIGPLYTAHALGSSYEQLKSLWFGFGVFTVLRFTASGLGAHLIVSTDSYLRPGATLLSLVVTLVLYSLFLPTYGLLAAPWLSSLSSLVLCVACLGLMQSNHVRRQPASAGASSPLAESMEPITSSHNRSFR